MPKEHSAFVFKVTQYFWTSFKMSWNVHPVTQRHITEYVTAQRHCCESLKSAVGVAADVCQVTVMCFGLPQLHLPEGVPWLMF
jgi:hypothetical protein